MSDQSRTPAVADVYAADTAKAPGDATAQYKAYSYAVEADPDPDVLLRVAGVCNLANVAPLRVGLERGTGSHLNPGERVIIRIQLDGISESTADSIRRKLLQLTCVTSVSLE